MVTLVEHNIQKWDKSRMKTVLFDLVFRKSSAKRDGSISN